MKIFNFKYAKNGVEPRNVDLLCTKTHPEYFEGIDLTKLTDEERATAKTLTDNYYAALKPFIDKAYRRFNVCNISEFSQKEF
jgi:hypothetical protein